MTKTQILDAQLSRIAEMTGDSTSHEQATAAGKETFLCYDYATHYGGYRLNRVRCAGGGHTRPFYGLSDTEPRMKHSEFLTLLNGIEIGLTIAKEKQEQTK